MKLPANAPLFINLAVFAAIILSLIFGYIKGFLWQVLKTIGLIAITIVAWILAPGLSDLVKIFPKEFAPFASTNLFDLFYDKINNLCWFLILLVVGLILLAILKPIFQAITSLPFLKQINGFLGAVASLIPTAIIILISTFILNSVIFANGKDMVNQSVLRYTTTIVDKMSSVLSGAIEENIAIQKMLNDPKSLKISDLKSIIEWMQKNQVSSEDIYNFLKNYGIDIVELNNLLNGTSHD